MALSNAYDIIIGRDFLRRYGASLNFDAANNDFISLTGGITLAALQFSEPAIGPYDIAVLNPNRHSDRDVNEDNAEKFLPSAHSRGPTRWTRPRYNMRWCFSDALIISSRTPGSTLGECKKYKVDPASPGKTLN